MPVRAIRAQRSPALPLVSPIVGISPYLRELRELVGDRLLVLPSVAVLLWDAEERLLLVRESQTGQWQTIGGAVEPDESPHEAAAREAAEEANVVIAIERLRSVLGGPEFRLRYPNGDRVSYVPTVFDARLVSGVPRADGDETTEVAWFSREELATADLTDFTVSLLAAAGVG
jgi:8-oxo-dGTP pyrophosphatase MutT (NUDIX family)